MEKITLKSLQREMDKQAAFFQQTVDDDQLQNLEYALHRIQPANHQECTFVVWCGTRPEPVTNQIDEYARRRNGGSPQMADHSILSLTTWCVPESYRILVYREQFQALIRELTGFGTVKALEVLSEVLRKNNINCYLQSLLIDTWKDSLADKEKDAIFGIIQHSYPRSIPYAWCSTIVERALSR